MTHRLHLGLGATRAAVLGIVILLGVANLPRALAGDQALFVIVARSMQHGEVLYRDIWDAKQPGIYAFYWLSGRLFGFDDVGVHTGELLWLLAFSVLLQRTLPDLGFSEKAAAYAPLLVVVPYQVLSTTWDLTQLEALIGLPLYVALWASVRAQATGSATFRWQVAAGAAGALVAAFKLLYLPVPLAFLALSSPRWSRRRAIGGWLAGAGFVWLPLAGWVIAHGLVHEVGYTWLRFPRTSRELGAPPAAAFVTNARSFARSMAPVGLAAAFGLWARRTSLDRWMVLALAWLGVASAMNLTQFWWRYLYWNLSVPLGLFALTGVGALARRARRTPAVGLAGATLAAVLVVASMLPNRERYRHTLGLLADPGTTGALRASEQELYADLDATLAVLNEAGATPGAVVVFGNPIVQLASGRPQSGRIPGFLANTLGPDEWHEVADAMRRTPPAYVFVGRLQGRDEQSYLDTRGREVQDILDQDYCEAAVVRAGRWLVRCR